MSANNYFLIRDFEDKFLVTEEDFDSDVVSPIAVDSASELLRGVLFEFWESAYYYATQRDAEYGVRDASQVKKRVYTDKSIAYWLILNSSGVLVDKTAIGGDEAAETVAGSWDITSPHEGPHQVYVAVPRRGDR